MPRNDNCQLLPDIEKIQLYASKLQYIQIPIEIICDERIPHIAKLIFGIVLATGRTEEGSFWGNAKLEHLLDVSQPVISKAYATLEALGLIKMEFDGRRRVARSLYGIGLVNSKERTQEYLSLLGRVKDSFRQPKRKQLANIKHIIKKDNKNLYTTNSAENPRAESDKKESSISRTAKLRAAKQAKLPDPAIAAIVGHFKTRCKEVLGVDLDVASRDWKTVKEKLLIKSETEIKKIIDDCLTNKNTQWQREHPTLSVFLSVNTINQLKMNKPAGTNYTPKSGYVHSGTEYPRGKQYSNVDGSVK